jgi:hypothetical protein
VGPGSLRQEHTPQHWSVSYLPLLSTPTPAEMAPLALCSPVQAGCVRFLVINVRFRPRPASPRERGHSLSLPVPWLRPYL